EVEAVVARIKRWLQESGGALEEAAIVAADPETYLPELFRALDEAGLPCSRSRTRPLSDHPLFRTVRAALLVRMGRKDMGLHLLRSPYIPWGDRRTRGEWAAHLRRWGMPDWASGLRKRLEQMSGKDEERVAPMLRLLEWVDAIPLSVPGRSGLPGSGSGSAGSSRRRRDRNWPEIPVCCRFWPRISTPFASWIRSRRSGRPYMPGSAPTARRAICPPSSPR